MDVETISLKGIQMNTTTQIPATENEGWGFWGTMKRHAETAWPLAMTTIAVATGQPLESVRLFLDSRFGRHFANEVQDGLHDRQPLQDAIAAVTRRWMSQKFGSTNSREYGVAHHLPSLTGYVLACQRWEDSWG